MSNRNLCITWLCTFIIWIRQYINKTLSVILFCIYNMGNLSLYEFQRNIIIPITVQSKNMLCIYNYLFTVLFKLNFPWKHNFYITYFIIFPVLKYEIIFNVYLHNNIYWKIWAPFSEYLLKPIINIS